MKLIVFYVLKNKSIKKEKLIDIQYLYELQMIIFFNSFKNFNEIRFSNKNSRKVV